MGRREAVLEEEEHTMEATITITNLSNLEDRLESFKRTLMSV